MARQVTITLDDDVAEKLDREARRIGAPITEVVTRKLRDATAEPPIRREPFKVYARDLQARPGVDFECVSRLLDEDGSDSLK
ncbi:MAG: ribbon-helix-helix protein, CopG family [Thermoanaerobaculia bacterium]